MKKNHNKTTDKTDVMLRLVNKKTGNLASSTDWLIDLAAVAKELGDSSGISALLPQKKAAKLLVRNELKPYKIHREKSLKLGEETSHKDLRVLVKLAYPELALFYIQNVVPSHKPNQHQVVFIFIESRFNLNIQFVISFCIENLITYFLHEPDLKKVIFRYKCNSIHLL